MCRTLYWELASPLGSVQLLVVLLLLTTAVTVANLAWQGAESHGTARVEPVNQRYEVRQHV